MVEQMQRTVKQEKGFTLAEVIIAILILAGSLAVLLTLQSASVKKALRDRNQMHAMLLARSIFSSLEIQENLYDLDREDSVRNILEDYNAVPDVEDLKDLDRLSAHLKVEEWENPEMLADLNLGANLLRRVYLKIFWGETPDDQLEVVYFIPNQ